MTTAPKKSVTQHTRADGQKQSVNRAGGKFDDKGASVAGAAASAFEEGPEPTFEEILNTPTEEDVQRSYELASSELLFTENLFWGDVMGSKTRRTDANRATYEARVKEVVDRHPEAREEALRSILELNAYGRAYEQNVTIDPVAESYFEEVWADEEANHGENGIRRELARQQTMLSQLERGEITPKSVIGKAQKPMEAAREWIEDQIARNERALETRGRSLHVLASNARGRVRAAHRQSGEQQ